MTVLINYGDFKQWIAIQWILFPNMMQIWYTYLKKQNSTLKLDENEKGSKDCNQQWQFQSQYLQLRLFYIMQPCSILMIRERKNLLLPFISFDLCTSLSNILCKGSFLI